MSDLVGRPFVRWFSPDRYGPRTVGYVDGRYVAIVAAGPREGQPDPDPLSDDELESLRAGQGHTTASPRRRSLLGVLVRRRAVTA